MFWNNEFQTPWLSANIWGRNVFRTFMQLHRGSKIPPSLKKCCEKIIERADASFAFATAKTCDSLSARLCCITKEKHSVCACSLKQVEASEAWTCKVRIIAALKRHSSSVTFVQSSSCIWIGQILWDGISHKKTWILFRMLLFLKCKICCFSIIRIQVWQSLVDCLPT